MEERLLVVRVESDLQARDDLLRDARVEIVRALGPNGPVELDLRFCRRTGEASDRGGRDEFLTRRREVTGVAGVHRRRGCRFPHRVQTGTELPLAGERLEPIEPQPA